LACQDAERLPEAYKAAQEVEILADAQKDAGLKSDALASRAQILLDSGDEIGALSLFNEALDIARELGDKRREMNLRGALGNYSLKLASMQRGEAYFAEAVALAQEIGHRDAEIGFLGNLASIYEWTERYAPAEKMFVEVLAHLQSKNETAAILQVYRHLIKVNEKQNKHSAVIGYAEKAIPLADKRDKALLMTFAESLITAHYKRGDVHEAHQATRRAITLARSAGEKEKEASFILSLAESHMMHGQLTDALETYQAALEALRRRSRVVDVAHVTGRIGMILAEMGRIEEAIPFHMEATTLAEKNELPALEGEQLTMLAMAYQEKGERKKAREVLATAVSVYTRADLANEAQKAAQLQAQLG
jgi:tetratricopeptide (TPR) repeat protein